MAKRKRYSRNTTTLTPSLIYEYNQLGKLNFNPPYQRDDNVWDDEQRSFLIDTMLKNFPMPPIFLEQTVDPITRKTYYDVIDGKQRLKAIISFIDNEVKLPNVFGKDEYGSDLLNNKTYDEITELARENEDAKDFLDQFWSYIINVEYIENPDVKIVDGIFDRLNRGGERLNPQELRKANFYDTQVYQAIADIRNDPFISNMLRNVNKNRLADISFITEIFLLLYYSKVIDGNESIIDEKFEELTNFIDEKDTVILMENFYGTLENMKKLNIDLDQYSINGVSHQYALWFFAFYLYKNMIEVDEPLIKLLNVFYFDLRNGRKDKRTQIYHNTMQSSSRSRSARKRRVEALLDYCGIKVDLTEY